MSSQLRPIPGTDLLVHPWGLGTNVFGHTVDEETAFRILDAFTAMGGNLIDTADSYCAWLGNGGGESETIIGRWLRSRRSRDQVVIATKVGQLPGRDNLRHDTIIAAADDALRRLGVDHLDLFYAHEDHGDPTDETVTAFDELVQSGKVRYAAASNYGADRLQEALGASSERARYVALQPRYNLMDREPYESALAPVAAEHDLGVFPWWGLASGFLTGKYPTTGPALDTPRAPFVEEYRTPRGERVLSVLREVAVRHDAAPAAVALAWLAGRPQVVAPLASVTSLAQLDELAPMATIELDGSDLSLLDHASLSQPSTALN
ncbi:MAG TPA: aldo/keto reductase [Marmoricola sp.]|nr:aldo/keto reductase [Marmoricola sp.]